MLFCMMETIFFFNVTLLKCRLKDLKLKPFLNVGTLKYVSTGSLAGLLLLLTFVDKNDLIEGCF